MKKLLVLLCALMFLCCKPVAGPDHYDLRSPAQRAEDRSVAMVTMDEDGTYSPNCSGVWVAPDRILTAFHCVKDIGKPRAEDAIQQLMESMGADIPPELRSWIKPWDPTGQLAHYTDKKGSDTEPETPYDAMIVACDPDNDLAELQANANLGMPWHDWAPISERVVHDGDEVDVVGSTLGMAFTYSHGYVSATREKGFRNSRFKTFQISAPIFLGNSGGGAFDDHGDLIGISDFVKMYEGQVVPCVGFFTHRDVIKEFLHAHR